MQLRMIHFLRRRRVNIVGSLVCGKCGAEEQIMLFEGGVCKSCFDPKSVNTLDLPKTPQAEQMVNCKFKQLQDSVELRLRVVFLMKEHDLTQTEFAARVGISLSRLNAWLCGQMGSHGQQRVNRTLHWKLHSTFKGETVR